MKIRSFFVLFIRLYQLAISPLFPPCCRYIPSCSAYAHEAVEKHGPFIGLYLACFRILRCHPFANGGYDPVPEKSNLSVLKNPFQRFPECGRNNLNSIRNHNQ